MYIKNNLRKLIVASIIAGGIAFSPVVEICDFPIISIAHAEIQTYTGTGGYLMSDGETMDIAKQGAKMHAIRNAQEQAGIFLSSRSEVKNGKLTKDEIETFTVGVVKVKEVKYRPVPLDDGGYIKFIATVTVTIDTDDLNQKMNDWLNKELEERSKMIDNATLMQKQIDEQAKRIKELEQIIANSNTNLDKDKINAELKTIDNETLAIQKWNEGNNFLYQNNYQGSMSKFSEAIELNPNYADAYNNRGVAYGNLGNYKQAIVDFNKAIQINPNYASAYNSRGLCYQAIGNIRQAQADFAKARQLGYNG